MHLLSAVGARPTLSSVGKTDKVFGLLESTLPQVLSDDKGSVYHTHSLAMPPSCWLSICEAPVILTWGQVHRAAEESWAANKRSDSWV